MATKRYPLIDVFRFLCACLVIMIHCVEIKEGHPIAHMIVTCFSRQAVPFFFTVSGFFFYIKLKKSDNPLQTVIKYSKRIFFLYFVWALISLPGLFISYSSIHGDSSPLYFAALLIRRVLFAGCGVFWYLLVLAESSLVCGLLLAKQKEKLLCVISVIGVILYLTYSLEVNWFFFKWINKAIYFVFSSSGNPITQGIPMFALGCAFAAFKERIHIKKSVLWVAYTAICAVNVIAFILLYEEIDAYEKYFVLSFLQAAVLFAIGITSDINVSERIGVELRDMSSTIYCVHSYFILSFVDKIWSLYSPVLLRFTVPLVLSIAVYYIVKFSKIKWLQRIMTLK